MISKEIWQDIESAWQLRYANKSTSKQLSDKIFNIAKDTDNKKLLAYANLLQGVNLFLSSTQTSTAVDLLRSSIDLFAEFPYEFGNAAAHYYLGNLYDTLSLFDNALKYAQKGLSLSVMYQLNECEADALSIIALINNRLGDYNKSLQYLSKCLEIRLLRNEKNAIAATHNQIALTYTLKNDYQNAKIHYLNALALRKEFKDENGLPWTFIGLGNLEEGNNEDLLSEKYYLQALELNKSNNDQRINLHSWKGLGKIYLKLMQISKAIEYLVQAEGAANDLESQTEIYKIALLLSQCYELSGNTLLALKYLKKHVELKDQILNQDLYTKLKQKEVEIEQIKNVELKDAYNRIDIINKNIFSSLQYAQHIQHAILPTPYYLNQILPEYFILYKPKDIVSGDFYFVETIDEFIVFAVVDCTGHGVPGAMLSMMGHYILHQAVSENKLSKPHEILNYLDNQIHKTLKHDDELQGVKDGMDLVVCSFNTQTYELQFSGAFNSLYHIRNFNLTEFKGCLHTIGQNLEGVNDDFANHMIKIEKGDSIYMSTDGYPDQFGGSKRKKILSSKLKSKLIEVQTLTLTEQKQKLNEYFDEWKGKIEQYDDVLILGIKF